MVSVVSGHGFEVLLSVGPRQQLIDVAVWMTVDDPDEDVGHPERLNCFAQFGNRPKESN